MARIQYNGGPEGGILRRVYWAGSALTAGDAVCCASSTVAAATDDLNKPTSVGTYCVDSNTVGSGAEYFVGVATQNHPANAGWIEVMVPVRGDSLIVNLGAATTITIGDAITVDESNVNKFVGFSPAGTTAANNEEADLKTLAVALTVHDVVGTNQAIVRFI